MPNYNEQAVSGTTWLRANRVTCNNGHEHKNIWFDEERVIVGPDGERITATTIGMGCGATLSADNASTAFPLLDADGNPTGQTSTYSDVYLILMSLYYHVANQRDVTGGGDV